MITVASIFALLFISTGIVHSLNKTSDFNINIPDNSLELTFDWTFYYMIITIFTIGYGDFYPTTALSRAIIGLFIIIVIIIMSQQTSKLGELMKNTSPYRKVYKTEPNKHIIISGSFSGTTLFRFLKELYHMDHNIKMKTCKVLIVRDQPPSREILAILNHPIYEETVSYLEGDLIDHKILKSAAVKMSKGVFILTDQYLEEVGPSDTYAVLASSAVKEYSSATPVFLQLVKPDLLIHSYWAGWNSGFSTWQLKLSLLASNVFTPGISTLICNLIVSSSGSMKKQALKNHWINEYVMGLSNELYMVDFPIHLVGNSFVHIVEVLYHRFESLLIGVQTALADSEDKETQEIILNPVDYVIKPGDRAFIISSDLETAENIKNLDIDSYEFNGEMNKLERNFEVLKTPAPKKTLKRVNEGRHFIMWEHDLRGKIWDHIIVFGRIEHLEIILESFNKMTSQTICYVTDHSPDEKWNRIMMKNKDVLYFECTLSDITELSHTAINFSHHVIILSSKIPGSDMEDSATLPLVEIIESHFSVHFTVELVDEVNMKYMANRFPVELEGMPLITWPRYAAANVFCSSAMDYITAQGYHNSFIIDLIRRMVLYEDLYSSTGIDENCRINSIDIPEDLQGRCTFKDVFCYLISIDRPVIPLAIYRGIGFLNNDINYVFTKPDFDAPLFMGDKLIVMGELNRRFDSPFLKSARMKLRKKTTINLSRSKSVRQGSSNFCVTTSTLADIAVQQVEQEERVDGLGISDEEIIKMIEKLLEKNKKERGIIEKQNRTLLNLASEYFTMQDLLNSGGAGD